MKYQNSAFALAHALVLLLSASYNPLSAQNFNGIIESNYMGLTGNYTNPSSISTSASKVALNIAETQYYGSMDQKFISLSSIMSGDELKINPNASGAFKTSNVLDLRPVSFMLRKGKLAFSLSSRVRSFINLGTSDPLFLDIATGKVTSLGNRSLDLSSTYMHLSVMSDIGIGASMPVMSSGSMRIFAGGTLRFYTGATHSGLYIDRIKGKYIDTSASFQVDNLDLGMYSNLAAYQGLLDLDYTDPSSIINSFQNNDAVGKGFGMDLGGTLLMGNEADNPGQYKFKFGASLTDLGSITYAKSSEFNASGSSFFRADSVKFDDGLNYDSIRAELISLGFQVSDGQAREQRHALPSMMHLQADMFLRQHFFVSAHMAFSMHSSNSPSAGYTSFLTVAPRFESRLADVSIPLSIDMTNGALGLGLAARFYCLYFGTQNFLGLFQEYASMGSAYAGLSFNFGNGDKKKRKQMNEM